MVDMSMFTITKEEWESAHKYLDDKPNGTKLPYSQLRDSDNFIYKRRRYLSVTKDYPTMHSFIKINEKIYALAQGTDTNARINDGSMAKVKYAKNEAGELYLIKIDDTGLGREEGAILFDLSISPGSAQRYDRVKHYTTMTHLGLGLNKYLGSYKPISDEIRLDMAIELCWETFRLHTGLASKTHTPYAHLDIKPDNVTVDKNHHVHLIDFGLAIVDPRKTNGTRTGAQAYVAYQNPGEILTNEDYDLVALKRVLYLPKSTYDAAGFREFMNSSRAMSILKEAQLNEFDLHRYISTHANKGEKPHYSKTNLPAVVLCALLIAAKHNRQDLYQRICSDMEIALAVTGLYFSASIQELDHVLEDVKAIKIVAALNATNQLHQLNNYKNDLAFYQSLDPSSPHEMVCASLYLKNRHLEKYSDIIRSTPMLVKAINALCTAKLEHYIDELLENYKNTLIVEAINRLNENGLQSKFQLLFENPDLRAAIALVVIEESKQAMFTLLKANTFAPQVIISVSEDIKLAKAINILTKYYGSDPNLTLQQYEAAIKYPEMTDAICNLKEAGMPYVTPFILSLDQAKAVNILHKTDKMYLIRGGVFTEEKAKLILLLKQLNLKIYDEILSHNCETITETYQVLNYSYAKEITPDMLLNDKTRKILVSIGDSIEQFRGFQTLYSFGYINHKDYQFVYISKQTYDAINLLTVARLLQPSYINAVLQHPRIAVDVCKLLGKERNVNTYKRHLNNILEILPENDGSEFKLAVNKLFEPTQELEAKEAVKQSKKPEITAFSLFPKQNTSENHHEKTPCKKSRCSYLTW